MAQEWTRDAIIHTIKETILIGQLQVGNGSLSAEEFAQGTKG